MAIEHSTNDRLVDLELLVHHLASRGYAPGDPVVVEALSHLNERIANYRNGPTTAVMLADVHEHEHGNTPAHDHALLDHDISGGQGGSNGPLPRGLELGQQILAAAAEARRSWARVEELRENGADAATVAAALSRAEDLDAHAKRLAEAARRELEG